MGGRLAFDMISPDKHLFSAEVDIVTVPGSEGDFGVLANHSPVMSVLRPGLVVVEDGGTVSRYFVRGGFADVTPEGLTILAEQALALDDGNRDALDEAIARARDELDAGTDGPGESEAGRALALLEELASAG